MTKSRRWSNRSPDCRIELRPSRSLAACLVALGALGAVSWFMSDASFLPVALGALAWSAGAAVYARRELRRPVSTLVLGADGLAHVDGRPVEGFSVDWRGALFTMSWLEGGRRVRRLAFPDALGAAERRQLRLSAPQRRERVRTAAVAP